MDDATQKPIRYLAMEDGSGFTRLIKPFLEKTGRFEVTVANSAEQALALLDNATFDVMTSDILTPGMDGGKLAKIVRQRYPDLPIGFITTRIAKEKYPQGTMIDGFPAHAKPVALESLIALVANLAGRTMDAKETAARARKGKEKPIKLLVMDYPGLARLFRLVLNKTQRFVVTEANSVEQVLRCLKKDTFDVLLSNYLLGVTQDGELQELVSREYPELRIGLMSGFITAKDDGKIYAGFPMIAQPLSLERLLIFLAHVSGRSIDVKAIVGRSGQKNEERT